MYTRLEIALYVERLSNVTVREFVNDAIQVALDQLYQFHDFPFYLQEGAIEPVDNYSTGTVTITQGSKTLTGSGTTFTSAMVGRKFRIQNEKAYYRIASYTSATVVTLDENYQGSDQSGASYEIYQDEYRLAADVDKFKMGIGMAFMIASFSRALIFLVNAKKKGYL